MRSAVALDITRTLNRHPYSDTLNRPAYAEGKAETELTVVDAITELCEQRVARYGAFRAAGHAGRSPPAALRGRSGSSGGRSEGHRRISAWFARGLPNGLPSRFTMHKTFFFSPRLIRNFRSGDVRLRARASTRHARSPGAKRTTQMFAPEKENVSRP